MVQYDLKVQAMIHFNRITLLQQPLTGVSEWAHTWAHSCVCGALSGDHLTLAGIRQVNQF